MAALVYLAIYGDEGRLRFVCDGSTSVHSMKESNERQVIFDGDGNPRGKAKPVQHKFHKLTAIRIIIGPRLYGWHSSSIAINQFHLRHE